MGLRKFQGSGSPVAAWRYIRVTLHFFFSQLEDEGAVGLRRFSDSSSPRGLATDIHMHHWDFHFFPSLKRALLPVGLFQYLGHRGHRFRAHGKCLGKSFPALPSKLAGLLWALSKEPIIDSVENSKVLQARAAF